MASLGVWHSTPGSSRIALNAQSRGGCAAGRPRKAAPKGGPRKDQSRQLKPSGGESTGDIAEVLALGENPYPEEVRPVLLRHAGSWLQNPQWVTNLLQMLVQRGRGQVAKLVLDFMRGNGIEVSTTHCNTLISAFQDTQGQESTQWLAWMRTVNLQPDVVSYNSVLRQSADAKEWEQAFEILNDMAENEIHANIRSLNIVIDACLQSGKRGRAVQLALSVHKWDLEVDAVTCASILQAFQEKGNWQKALSLLSGMPELDLVANEFCFASTMTSCVNSQEWEWAFHLFNTMQFSQLLPDAPCYSAAMGACDESGQWELALGLLNHMVKVQVPPNEACFSATLASLKAPQEWTIALELLSLMVSVSSLPNRIHWNAAMNTCASSEWQKALEILQCMQQVEIDPNTDTCGAAMEAYRTAQLWQSALFIFKSIPTLQILPGLRSYNNVLNALHDVECGEEIWREAVQSGVYPELLCRGANVLDLHHLSRGAAELAVRWWIGEVVPELLQTAPAPFYIIITGYLKGSKGDPVIRKVVSDLLDRLGVRFRATSRKEKGKLADAFEEPQEVGAFSLLKKYLSPENFRRRANFSARAIPPASVSDAAKKDAYEYSC